MVYGYEYSMVLNSGPTPVPCCVVNTCFQQQHRSVKAKVRNKTPKEWNRVMLQKGGSSRSGKCSFERGLVYNSSPHTHVQPKRRAGRRPYAIARTAIA